MRAIGFRAESGHVNWAVVSGTKEHPVIEQDGKVKVPKSADLAEAFSDVHQNLMSVIKSQRANVASIRIAETYFGRKPSSKTLGGMFARARLEGVVLLACHAQGVPVVAGQLATIRAGLKSKSASAYLDQDDFRGIDWSSKKAKEMREAILAAASALEASE